MTDTVIHEHRTQRRPAQSLGRREHESCTTGQCHRDFRQRHIEVDRGVLQDARTGGDLETRNMRRRHRPDARMGHHHALRRAAGARGVDHIGRMVLRQCAVTLCIARVGVTPSTRAGRSILIDNQLLDVPRQSFTAERTGPPILRRRRTGQHQHRPGLLHHQFQPLCGKSDIERQVGAPRLQYAQHRHQQGYRALDAQADHALRAHSLGDQSMRQSVRLRVQL